MTGPMVVAAYQSPTLFNILAQARPWNLHMAPMGDHGGLEEMQLLSVPIHKGIMAPPEMVLVCSPAHLDFAESRWPAAKRVWVFHNGRQRHLLSEENERRVHAGIAFSDRVARLQGDRSVPVLFVSPWYEPNPVWSWSPDLFWKLRNRPTTRVDDFDTVSRVVFQGLNLELYGQCQKLGFATPERREELMRSCSAYASCLDRGAGFGLAEHECLAAGVPLVSGWWGDMRLEMPDYDLHDDIDDMRMAAMYMSHTQRYAEALSEIGLQYISEARTRLRMEATVECLLDTVLGQDG